MSGRTASVVGAGIVGVCTALALQQRGFAVTMLDVGMPGCGCSHGNAGVITPSVFPLAASYPVGSLPGLLVSRRSPLTIAVANMGTLLPWFLGYLRASFPERIARGTTTLHALGQDAVSSYRALLGSDLPHLEPCGYLAAHLSPEESTAADRINEIRQALGSRVTRLDATQAAKLEPILEGVVHSASLIVDAVHVKNPGAFVRTLADVFISRGGTFRQDHVRDVRPSGETAVHVHGANQSHPSSIAVIATGADSNRLLDRLGHHIPLIAELGYHLDLAYAGGTIGRPISFGRFGAVITPTGDGARLAGLSHVGRPGLRPRPNLALCALERFREIIPPLSLREHSQVWSGQRPSTPDSIPVVERVPGTANVYLSTGHGHTGLTMAAVTASLLAAHVCGEEPQLLHLLGSSRFASDRPAESQYG